MKNIYLLSLGIGYDSICGTYETKEEALIGFDEFNMKGDILDIETLLVPANYSCMPIKW